MARFPGNPFARRETHSNQALWTYKALTILTWLVLVIASVYYTFAAPQDDKKKWRHTIWGQNNAHHTPFTLNSVITSLYWIVLFLSQIGYVWQLFVSNTDYVNAAAGVGSHFILNNLLQFGFVMLFVRGHFFWAEILLIANFFNLSTMHFRHNNHPIIHVPVVSGPLAWTFVALFWNGAIAVNAHSLPARLLANIAIWSILFYGVFYLAVYRDYTIGFELSILSASLGVGQFFNKAFALQWIFAFTIMAVLFALTLVIAIPLALGKNLNLQEGEASVAEPERAPLLDST